MVYFSRTRTLSRITIIICKIFAIIALVGAGAGVILGIILKSFTMFLIISLSCLGAAGIMYVTIIFMKWLMKDYEEVDLALHALNTMAKSAVKKNEEMVVVMEHVEQPKQVEPAPQEVPVEEKLEVNKEEPKVESANQKAPEVVVLKRTSLPGLRKGMLVQITKDFSDYGFNFKKGMTGTIDSEDNGNGIVSVHMTDKIKGFFRMSIENIEPVPEKK